MYRSGVLGLTHFGAPGMAIGAAESERCSGRIGRDPTAEARSPPARSACFPHPVQMSHRGVRAAAAKACLVIYDDHIACVDSKPRRNESSFWVFIRMGC